MSLLTIIRNGVATIDKVTKSLQAPVVFQRCTGTDGVGNPTFKSSVTLGAIVEQKMKVIKTMSGEEIMTTATVTFINIPALLAATPQISGPSGEVVSHAGEVVTRDKITLPNGRTQPVVAIGGFIDAGLGAPVATEVYLQ